MPLCILRRTNLESRMPLAIRRLDLQLVAGKQPAERPIAPTAWHAGRRLALQPATDARKSEILLHVVELIAGTRRDQIESALHGLTHRAPKRQMFGWNALRLQRRKKFFQRHSLHIHTFQKRHNNGCSRAEYRRNCIPSTENAVASSTVAGKSRGSTPLVGHTADRPIAPALLPAESAPR